MKIAFYSDTPQQGKTTASNYLIKEYQFKRIMLSKPFKDMLHVLLKSLGFDDLKIHRYIYGDLKETIIPELGVSPRYMMQTIGNE